MRELAELLRAAEREVIMRERVYPGRVRKGLMAQELADREIRAMRQIAMLLARLCSGTHVVVPLDAPVSIADKYDEALFELCRRDDYRALYRELVMRGANA
jgi:hypothetical protein